ncbi:MAG: hypothetical protein LBU26_01120, partial [Synergistaceae bacterium]|nr:hypothetical protein [Synergistaceae bacterium]
MDATIRGFSLSHESIGKIFGEVCGITVEDGIAFSVSSATGIREGDEYPGLRVGLIASYPPLRVPLTADVTAGAPE